MLLSSLRGRSDRLLTVQERIGRLRVWERA
jgi:hypothetical protein